MKTKMLWLIALAGFSAGFLGCKKEPLNNLTNEESRIYITDHDSTISFNNYKTYSISDSVAVLQNGKSSKQLNNVDQAYIDAVKSYMNQRGFHMVSKEQSPDLGINVNRIINTATGVISYNNYWNYYGDYWDPYYWGYPSYGYYLPYAYSVYSIREGALSIDMIDLKNASSAHKLNVVWTGLIRGEGIFDTTVADSTVKALFDQSPYLQSN